jgi:hypothetical protein
LQFGLYSMPSDRMMTPNRFGGGSLRALVAFAAPQVMAKKAAVPKSASFIAILPV